MHIYYEAVSCGPGDWFNRLDWSCASNNFGVGLPPAAKNEAAWPIKAPLLADPAMKPSPELIKVFLVYQNNRKRPSCWKIFERVPPACLRLLHACTVAGCGVAGGPAVERDRHPHHGQASVLVSEGWGTGSGFGVGRQQWEEGSGISWLCSGGSQR